jgi:microcin C transport system permease protein
MDTCLDWPEDILAEVEAAGTVEGQPVASPGWALWPPIPYSYNTINYGVRTAPSPPDRNHWLGTDDQTRDVVARVIYGFRISVLFALVVAIISSVIGIASGAIQGYFGGWIDLFFQRIVEIWVNLPSLYIIIILSAIFTMNFWLLTLLIAFFSWTSLVGVVRAEFLRARNFEYVRAARALGVGDLTIMFRHLLPNAMVATLTLLPFIITGAIGGLAALDFLGLGLPPSYPSLGELALQGKNRLNAPWLGFTAFFTFAIMLSLLVFIFEGVRDAFDPRKTFR